MKKMKLTDEILESSGFGELAKALSKQMKVLIDLRTQVESCFIPSAENSKPIVDPCRAKLILSDIVSKSSEALPGVAPLKETLERWIEGESRRANSSFEAALVAWCKRQEFKLEGHFPSFVIEGFCALTVDSAKGVVTVAHQKVKSLLFDAAAPLLAEIVAEERNRKFDRSKFIETLFLAYQRAIALISKTTGEPAPVKSIFQELVFARQSAAFKTSGKAAQFSEYTWDFFSRDVASLHAALPCKTAAGLKLNLVGGAFAEEGLPIRDHQGVRYIGRISFMEELNL